MAETKTARILVGDATGTWKCKIVDSGISPKDIRLLHRAIDVEFKRYVMSRRRVIRRRRVDDSLRSEAAAREQVKRELEERAAAKLQAAKDLIEKSETNKDSKSKPNPAKTAETAPAEKVE